ncbi:MmcQ/YjbR family DNA-binding protein [Zhihengliuella salsuginis]|uniref:DNA-binding protein n=1 Tax=Zhihengliuella salsuginis TaxID=578222 RepID=A0ABQ3GAN0_9MICC|nr:MmcQ/YjbR family DNA-binding protein [Zhihengliuella salsuginis]GHC99647.1 DNA-binding protein [Zhihengliuella salsuginis]
MSGGLTTAAVRGMCLALPGAFEDQPFGPDTLVVKVRGRAATRPRMFALIWGGERALASGTAEGPARMNLKIEPALGDQLRAAHPEITRGYHMNKRHWVTVACGAGLPEAMVRDMVEDSYDLVVESLPAADREALGWRCSAGG